MRKSRFTEEQIIGILQEAGAEVKELCRRHGTAPSDRTQRLLRSAERHLQICEEPYWP